jgi:hypothetical protein
VAVTNSDNDTQARSSSRPPMTLPTQSTVTRPAFTRCCNKGSDGLISLREAIIAANNSTNGSGGADRILFGIAGTGEHLINLAAALPTSPRR